MRPCHPRVSMVFMFDYRNLQSKRSRRNWSDTGMTKLTQRWTGRLSILVAAAVLLTGSIAGLNKWKLAANATSAAAKNLNPQQQEALAEAKVKSAVSKLPLAFEANLGQTDARVKYVARASGYAVYLTEEN